MPLLTADQVRGHLSAPELEDAALERLIADAEGAVVSRFGDGGPYTERPAGGGRFLFLGHPAASVASITEDDVALAADDYGIRHGGRSIERLSDGTNGRGCWGREVVVVYATASDVRRERVVVDLVKLSAAYSGYTTLADGAFRGGVGDYKRQREEILSELSNGSRRVA